MTSQAKIVGGVVIFTAIIFAVIIGLGGTKGNGASGTLNTDPASAASPQLNRPGEHTDGPSDAKVTVTEFGDFECPACAADQAIIDQIQSQYSGKIKLVFREFPLTSIHPNAFPAAMAAEAAANQNKFWEMHDKLYSNQSQWATASNPKSFFDSYANQLGLNISQFDKDMADQSVADRIRQDYGDAIGLGLDSTPTLYVGSQKMTSNGLTSLEQAINAALNK